MTEKDARTKWCPMAGNRAVTYWLDPNTKKQARFLVGNSEDVSTLCVASACALWVSCSTCWDDLPIDQRHGHCGLIRG